MKNTEKLHPDWQLQEEVNHAGCRIEVKTMQLAGAVQSEALVHGGRGVRTKVNEDGPQLG